MAARASASAVHRHIGQGASQKMRRKELAPGPPSQVGSHHRALDLHLVNPLNMGRRVEFGIRFRRLPDKSR